MGIYVSFQFFADSVGHVRCEGKRDSDHHTKSNVLQYNEYYPFGLNAATSWTRENVTGNNFLYDAGNEQNTLTGMYDLFFRNYDPALGRMHQVDPLADKYGSHTTYKYGFNNPIFWNDPSGAGEDQEADREMKMRKYSEDFVNGQRAEVDNMFRNEFKMFGSEFDASAFQKYGPGGVSSLGGPVYDPVSKKTVTPEFRNGELGLWVERSFIDNSTQNFNGAYWIHSTIIKEAIWFAGSIDHFRAMNNTLVQAIHRGQQEFVDNPFGGALMTFLTGGPLLGMGGFVGSAALGSRLVSGATDAGIQVTMNMISNGGDFWRAIQRVNVTSIALSAASPVPSFTSVLKNSAFSSVFELRFMGTQNIVTGGKSLGDVALSVGVSTMFFGLNQLGSKGMSYARERGDYLIDQGFSPVNSNAYQRLVWGVGVPSKVASVTGFYGGFSGN